jgi:hypothetical protein
MLRDSYLYKRGSCTFNGNNSDTHVNMKIDDKNVSGVQK